MLRRSCEHGNDAGQALGEAPHTATHRITAGVWLPAAQGRHAESKSRVRLAPDPDRRQASTLLRWFHVEVIAALGEIPAASMCQRLSSGSLFAAIWRCGSCIFWRAVAQKVHQSDAAGLK